MTDNLPGGVHARLNQLADRVGGKRALAAGAKLSEAQLYRYLSGDGELSVRKLVNLARAGEVSVNWLLNGEGPMVPPPEAAQPFFRPALMFMITEALDTLLLEWPDAFGPRQRARLRNVLYLALRHEETRRGRDYIATDLNMVGYVSFLSGLRSEEELTMLEEVQMLLEYSGKPDYTQHLQKLIKYCNYLVRGIKSYYTHHAGQLYFDRMGQQLDSETVRHLTDVVEQAAQLVRKPQLDWLDVGCGNGRHLSHLHKHFANLTIRGLELSQLGVDLCRTLEAAGRLPEDCVQQGDMRLMPFRDATCDVVYARMSLWSLPYWPGTGLGVEAAMAEMSRVLRPGGVLIVTTLLGTGRDYLLFRQFLSEADLQALAQNNGLKIITLSPNQFNFSNGGNTQQTYLEIYNTTATIILQKT
jgi:SAM-dependent methyltransferase